MGGTPAHRGVLGTPLTPVSPQNSMNLPPDKMQLLSQYDNEKKWELVCDQVRSKCSEASKASLLALSPNATQGWWPLASDQPSTCG